MKARTCLASSVCCSDEFLALSLEAALLYVMLTFEASVSGSVVGVYRLTRGYGFDRSTLDELYDAGYLLDVGGVCYIRHHWLHSSYNQRFVTQAEEESAALQSGALAFEGEPFRSAYRIVDGSKTEQRLSKGDSIRNGNGNGNGNGSCNGSPTEMGSEVTSTEAVTLSVSENMTARALSFEGRCLCKKCGKEASYHVSGREAFVRCTTCGTYAYTPNKTASTLAEALATN